MEYAYFLLNRENKIIVSEFYDTYEEALEEWKKRLEEMKPSELSICQCLYNC